GDREVSTKELARISGVKRIFPCTPAMVHAQLEAVFEEHAPVAVKTGMLYSQSVVHEVVRFLRRQKNIAIVVDPVMISTSGRVLLQPQAFNELKRFFLPMATLVTPNVPEAEALSGTKIKTFDDMRAVAKLIQKYYHCAALIKGGHLPGARQASDILWDGKREWIFSAPFVRGARLHGTGCTYSAAITAGLAHGKTLPGAVEQGKLFINGHIRGQKVHA
ncbi:MAG: bifunctional hydroxymethylpyrimidine kinase/phosphomethylpyrimidine kinase, partial [Limisphaerales bacterium]